MNLGENPIVAKCLTLTQPIGTFYSCVIDHADVCEIAHADVRRSSTRNIEDIIGIQRDLKSSRVKDIRQYVQNVDASFPSSVILAVDHENAYFDEDAMVLRIRRGPEIAKIIDGQHRIRGLDEFDGCFQLICTVFIDMELEDQAMTFASINLAQTKVNKSIVYDLYEYQRAPSPQKTCHQVARLLNREHDSPFYKRIKILGKATGEPLEYITQAAFVERLLQYVSNNPMRDRNELKKGGLKKLPDPDRVGKDKLIFRELFSNKKDHVIAEVVWNYFDAVRNRWPEAWNSSERGMILNHTQGFAGLMRFLRDVYVHTHDRNGGLSYDSVAKIFSKIILDDTDFTSDNYPPGSTGESKLYKDLKDQAEISI